MSKDEKRKLWEHRIADFQSSGQTQMKWCEINQISIHQLKYWLKKVSETPSKNDAHSKWIPVTVNQHIDKVDESLVLMIGQVKIEVKPGYNPTFLADVVKTVQNL